MRPPVSLLVVLALCLGVSLLAEWAPERREAQPILALDQSIALDQGCADGCGCPIERTTDGCCCLKEPAEGPARPQQGLAGRVRGPSTRSTVLGASAGSATAAISDSRCARAGHLAAPSAPGSPVVLVGSASRWGPAEGATLPLGQPVEPALAPRSEPATPPPRRGLV